MLGVADALDEVEPTRHELIAIVHDENAPHAHLDVVALLLHPEEDGAADTLDELEQPRHELIVIVHDEYAPHAHRAVAALLLHREEVAAQILLDAKQELAQLGGNAHKGGSRSSRRP